MMEIEGCGNDTGQAKSPAMELDWSLRVRDAANAAGPNPTLVQNDEHVLVRGHRPGRGNSKSA